MPIASIESTRSQRGRPPGLYVETQTAVPVAAPELMTGVPAFVGFARVDPELYERAGSKAVVLDRWDARLWAGPIAPADGSFLRAAVRGYFANGGRRCVLLALPPTEEDGAAARALLDILDQGGALADRSDVDLLCVPDAVGPRLDPGQHRQVLSAILRHCEAAADRFALLDAPPAPARASGDDAVVSWLHLASDLRSDFGALYAPWVAPDPTRDDDAALSTGAHEWRCLSASKPGVAAPEAAFVPPCGHVAGLIARLDSRLGPQQSPANQVLDGVLDTAWHLSPVQHGQLNEAGVNCIQGERGRGIRVGGARTLSSDALRAYVSSTRVVLGFRRWLAVRMRDLVFEPHTPRLRDLIRSRLIAHCLDLQRAGALAGSHPDDGFFVKCDAETNRPEERDLGRVIAHVGLAPSLPAEFILVRIVQDASGFTVSGFS